MPVFIQVEVPLYNGGFCRDDFIFITEEVSTACLHGCHGCRPTGLFSVFTAFSAAGLAALIGICHFSCIGTIRGIIIQQRSNQWINFRQFLPAEEIEMRAYYHFFALNVCSVPNACAESVAISVSDEDVCSGLSIAATAFNVSRELRPPQGVLA